jgi:hypothetical protein
VASRAKVSSARRSFHTARRANYLCSCCRPCAALRRRSSGRLLQRRVQAVEIAADDRFVPPFVNVADFGIGVSGHRLLP